MRWFVVAGLILALSSCGSANPRTAQQVVDQFKAGGIAITNVRLDNATAKGSPIPQSFTDDVAFADPTLTDGKGGQVFSCATKKNCDAIYAYFDMFKGLAGPYLYQSKDGRIVAQLNSGLTPAQAAKYQAIVEQ